MTVRRRIDAQKPPGRKKGGGKTPGSGRRKGTPNKLTRNVREVLAAVADSNAERVQAWLDEIAKTDGARAALECYLAVLEYSLPKLQRTELHLPPQLPDMRDLSGLTPESVYAFMVANPDLPAAEADRLTEAVLRPALPAPAEPTPAPQVADLEERRRSGGAP